MLVDQIRKPIANILRKAWNSDALITCIKN